MTIKKPLLHRIFAQNALTPDTDLSEIIKNQTPLFLVTPQGPASHIRKMIPTQTLSRNALQTKVSCWEETNGEVDKSRDVAISIASDTVKLVFSSEKEADGYLHWLKTSEEERTRVSH